MSKLSDYQNKSGRLLLSPRLSIYMIAGISLLPDGPWPTRCVPSDFVANPVAKGPAGEGGALFPQGGIRRAMTGRRRSAREEIAAAAFVRAAATPDRIVLSSRASSTVRMRNTMKMLSVGVASVLACLIGDAMASASFAQGAPNSRDTDQVGTWVGVQGAVSGTDQTVWVINSRTGAARWCHIKLGGTNKVVCTSE